MNQSILIARSSGGGGVANYYDAIRPYLPSSVEYCIIHNPQARGLYEKLCFLPLVLWRFTRSMRKVSLVCLNPSLVPKSYYRDMLLLCLSKLFGKKVVVFFRGWDMEFENKIRSSHIKRFIFRKTYGTASAFIVLGDVFGGKLLGLGIHGRIFKMTTVASGNGCNDSDIQERSALRAREIRCLFMARLVPGKGIDEAVDMYLELKKLMPDYKVSLTVAGDGSKLQGLMNRLKEHKIMDVELVGYVNGKDKENLLKRMHVFLFPSYGEGMPNAILEAMLYGLIIVSTPVGGIPDVVTDGENGILFLLNERSASVKRLSELLHDSTRVTQVAMLNHKIACGSFVPEKVAQRLMCIIISVLAKSAMSMEKF